MTSYLNNNKIFLVGFMASGKSTVGPLLASKLNMKFYDTDLEIQKKLDMSIKDIFEQKGECFFRTKEKETLRYLSEKEEPSVISCGGGTVLNKENIAIIKKNGIGIFLNEKSETVLKRVKDPQSRPLLKNIFDAKEIEKLINSRMPYYKQATTITIETDNLTPNEVVELIYQRIK